MPRTKRASKIPGRGRKPAAKDPEKRARPRDVGRAEHYYCKHKRRESFEGEEGFWASCPTCKAYTPEYATVEEADAAMTKLLRLINRHTGVNSTDQRVTGFLLSDVHRERLEAYRQKHRIPSKSAALRHAIELLDI